MKGKNIKVDKAYLVSCVNSRLDDITEAANVLRGNKIADGVEFYIAAASSEVQAESEQRGDWQALLNAGATPLPPGCGPCIGLGTGLLEDGEVGISATNRNFKGRMGSPNAEAYLASPAVVAYSAMKGKIDFDWTSPINNIDGMIEISKPKPIESKSVRILDGFPEKIEGNIIFCHQDNMNTDGIYPGKYTYVDDFKPEDQAKVAMENYDPEFQKLVGDGDILVGGYNFGTGSSREQAATALKYRGIQLVIVGSASQTYKRNALNNGFLVIEIPQLVDDLKAEYGKEKLTVQTSEKAIIDYRNSSLTFKDKIYKFGAVGTAAQELVIMGGLENWVKNNL
jgi:homoaconitate hydratase